MVIDLFPPPVVMPGDHARPRPAADASRVERAWHALHGVLDPEVPALSVCDLGIVRDVRDSAGTLEVDLTPTYSGCPATDVIERAVIDALEAAGLGPVKAATVLSPAWTTDWMSEEGRRKLREYGIAPPGRCRSDASTPPAEQIVRFVPRRARAGDADANDPVACPRCDSTDTERLSAFGATACKALYRCRACREPFEAFKVI
jgi:ring-1,2-phenylacetyl-CoA epoxidase subunit PaaD